MIYSCFDQQRAEYVYYADDSRRPINGDLPVPRLPSPTGKIGVPTIEAGRTLPAGAKPIGRGWHARGILVRCDGGGSVLNGLGGVAEAATWVSGGGWKWIVGGLAAVWLVRQL